MADDADELYALPLGEFTSARNDLEKRLRKDGKREEAAEVKGRRKPTAPAWALNQVARERPKVVAELVETGRPGARRPGKAHGRRRPEGARPRDQRPA